jgi:undecaprenyl-diphosphatase
MNRLDASLFRLVNRLAGRTAWAHGLAVAYAKLGIGLFALLLLAGWWSARAQNDPKVMATVLWAGAGCLVALGLNQVVGGLVGRARPYAAMPDVHVLISRTSDFSFPSDHAVAVGAVATGLLVANRRLGGAAAALALLMAVARVYVGAHYPGDVAAGLVVGAVVVLVGGVVAIPLSERMVDGLRRTSLRPLVSGPAPVSSPRG